MKKIVLLCAALLVGTLSAGAWTRVVDKAVLVVAYKNLNPQTQRILKSYIGEDITKPAGHLAWHRKNDRMLESEGWHRLHLDGKLQPAAKDENDAYVQIEKALEIVRNSKQYKREEVSLAIQIVMNLVTDMHNIANVTLESYPMSAADFQFYTSKGTAGGRKAKTIQYSWRNQWTYRYGGFHSGYTHDMYAEDIDLMFGDKKAEFSKGSLHDWAHDIGTYTTAVYELLQKNDNHFLHATVQAHEPLHMSCVARAAYRLAVLLNENLK